MKNRATSVRVIAIFTLITLVCSTAYAWERLSFLKLSDWIGHFSVLFSAIYFIDRLQGKPGYINPGGTYNDSPQWVKYFDSATALFFYVIGVLLIIGVLH